MAGSRMVDVPGYSNGWTVVNGGQHDHEEFPSPSVTRLRDGSLLAATGQCFFTNRDRPVFTFIAGASPGCHDMLHASCNRDCRAGQGVADHPDRRDSHSEAACHAGIGHVLQPDPVSLFQITSPGRDGRFVIGNTLSAAGDSVTPRADIDCILILTACSSERIVGGRSTPLRLEAHDRRPPAGC